MGTQTSTNPDLQMSFIKNDIKTWKTCGEQKAKIRNLQKLLKSLNESAGRLDKAINWEGYGLALGGAFITLGQLAWGIIDVVHEVGPKNFQVVTTAAKGLKPIAELTGKAIATPDKVTISDVADAGITSAFAIKGHKLGGSKDAVESIYKGGKAMARTTTTEMDAKAKGKRNWENHYSTAKDIIDIGATLHTNTKGGKHVKVMLAVIDSSKNIATWANRTYDSTTDSFDSRSNEKKQIASDIRRIEKTLGRMMAKLEECCI